ncbi:endonuclease/exonuclease/phosphatase family protein [Dietzia psychralcaliphila]|uniref:endonuclease/exonuclease/phosphatase family protein n=1 Tax=Dietzia psychralcaliphila TaxID=139021 RepID=UPI001F2553DD|nr:endonuclease/exonuclease/phosphatase family protein [Dietzia psychralcaliphila]
MRRPRPVARASAVLAALVAATGIALHHSTSEVPAVLVLATFALWAWAFSLVAVLAALRARSVLLTIVALALVGAGVIQYGPLVSPARGDDDEGVDLRVLVQNLEFGRADPVEVVRAVRDGGVDLLLTVEATPEAVDGLRAAGLVEMLPHEATDAAPQTAGVAVWSRYPLSPPERIPGFSLGVLRTDMAGPAGPVTVVAAHPVAPVFDGPTAVEEADRLRWYLGGLPGPAPVVVGGDFNATWDHARFRGLRGLGYTDSVSGGGDGWVPTWPAGRRVPPLIGIDHVLARGALSVGDTSTVRVGATDHLGVLATVRLPADRVR